MSAPETFSPQVVKPRRVESGHRLELLRRLAAQSAVNVATYAYEILRAALARRRKPTTKKEKRDE